jgi:hypothetical protein
MNSLAAVVSDIRVAVATAGTRAEATVGKRTLTAQEEVKALSRSFRKTSQCSAVPHYILGIAWDDSFRISQNRI